MKSSGEQGSVSCGTFIPHQEARTGNQLLMGEFEGNMQVRCCESPESFGKGILQREGIMVPGYAAPGGENFRPVCKGTESCCKRFRVFFSSK